MSESTQMTVIAHIFGREEVGYLENSEERSLKGFDGKYYKIENSPMLYDIRFPLAWAIIIHTQVKKTYCNFGPEWCGECRDKGILNGVFVGFCNYCATEQLNGKYGLGTETPISELSKEDVWRIYPYMTGAHIQDIGIPPTEENPDFIKYSGLEAERLRGNSRERCSSEFAPFQSREHMEAYEKTERERLGLLQESDEKKYSEHALLVTMGRAALDHNVGPMGQQMNWAEYREYLDNKWWDEC
uniref:Uncharacterized protein n=1 Tax=viral metagenome TaxID=1070528 RepID=A0A6C0K2P5_9ZZZZ